MTFDLTFLTFSPRITTVMTHTHAKGQDHGSLGSKVRVETDGQKDVQTDRGDCITCRINAVSSNKTRPTNLIQPVIRRVLASSLTFRIRGVCCHSNETHAPIANPPNSAQLRGTPYRYSELHTGRYSSVSMRQGTDTDRQTYRHRRDDQYAFRLAIPNAKCRESRTNHTFSC